MKLHLIIFKGLPIILEEESYKILYVCTLKEQEVMAINIALATKTRF